MIASTLQQLLSSLVGQNVCIHFSAGGVEIFVEELADQVTAFNFFARIAKVTPELIVTEDVREGKHGAQTTHHAYIPISKIVSVRTAT